MHASRIPTFLIKNVNVLCCFLDPQKDAASSRKDAAKVLQSEDIRNVTSYRFTIRILQISIVPYKVPFSVPDFRFKQRRIMSSLTSHPTNLLSRKA